MSNKEVIVEKENIISLRAYRTLKECQKLFNGYQAKLNTMEKADLLTELDRYRAEAGRYPSHLLTIVKGEILMKVIKKRSLTQELQSFASQEEQRLRLEVERRLYE